MHRLSSKETSSLLRQPESGMGYQRVDITMADGRELKDAVVLNAELLEVPAEFVEAIIADIRLHHEARPSRR